MTVLLVQSRAPVSFWLQLSELLKRCFLRLLGSESKAQTCTHALAKLGNCIDSFLTMSEEIKFFIRLTKILILPSEILA